MLDSQLTGSFEHEHYDVCQMRLDAVGRKRKRQNPIQETATIRTMIRLKLKQQTFSYAEFLDQKFGLPWETSFQLNLDEQKDLIDGTIVALTKHIEFLYLEANGCYVWKPIYTHKWSSLDAVSSCVYKLQPSKLLTAYLQLILGVDAIVLVVLAFLHDFYYPMLVDAWYGSKKDECLIHPFMTNVLHEEAFLPTVIRHVSETFDTIVHDEKSGTTERTAPTGVRLTYETKKSLRCSRHRTSTDSKLSLVPFIAFVQLQQKEVPIAVLLELKVGMTKQIEEGTLYVRRKGADNAFSRHLLFCAEETHFGDVV